MLFFVLVLGGAAGAAEDVVPDQHVEKTADQPFLYLTDPHDLAARQARAGYALAFSSSAGAIRPIPGHFDAEGVVHSLSLDAGLTSRWGLFGSAMIAQAIGHTEVGSVAVQAGARVLLTNPRNPHFSLALRGGLLLEFSNDLGAVGELTAAYDLGRLRLAASLHAEHIFASRRDPIDVYAVAGASVRVASMVRLGAEYVVQDLEAAFENDEAEGGARHYLGPDVALALFHARVLVTAGAAAQVASHGGVLARGALTYVY
jgi:hypothetical protein